MKNSRLKAFLVKHWNEIYDEILHKSIQMKYTLPIMTSEETIRHIRKNKCSIARYGDGEFGLMLEKSSVGFQEPDSKLAEALRNVLQNNSKDLLICVPYALKSTRRYKKGQFWRYWSIDNQKNVVTYIRIAMNGNKFWFGDTNVSRPYSGYKTEKMARTLFPMWKEIWKDRDVLFVEGDKTRLGVGNDLFDACKSIKRILAPAENAFSVYDAILNSVLKNWNGELVILALGPTATVLASDLSKHGIQALDLGHIDIQYEWFLGGKAFVPVAAKYTNESSNQIDIEKCTDTTYLSQIIDHITQEK